MKYFIPHNQVSTESSEFGFTAQAILGEKTGATNLTIRRIEVAPGGSVPLHIHPNSEEGMLVLEGELEATVADQVTLVGSGTSVFAPMGVKHKMTNKSQEKAVLLGIFPCLNPIRDLMEE